MTREERLIAANEFLEKLNEPGRFRLTPDGRLGFSGTTWDGRLIPDLDSFIACGQILPYSLESFVQLLDVSFLEALDLVKFAYEKGMWSL
jgi:hypothetical protein